ncbi:MAG: PKD domain-containing protein, partial [Bacteroidota bacterium]
LVGRIDLDLAIPGFQVVDTNVFSGKSVPMAGGVDKAPYHAFLHLEYTGSPICERSTSVLCQFPNAAISDGNNFTSPWEAFCQSGTRTCEAPTVVIDSPGDNSGVQVGTEVTISATVLDNDGSISSVVIEVDGTPIASSNTSGNTYAGNWTATDTGTSTITVTAIDNDGLVVSVTRTLIIYLTNPPPTASFVATPDYGAPALAVTFDASSSSDLNGDPLSYSWDFGDGSVGTGVLAEHTYPDEGVFTVTLTVDDGNGGTDDFSSPITVVAPNCDLALQYKTPDNDGGGATDNQIRAHFLLENTGDNTIALQDITIRYWYTKEGTAGQNAYVDYAAVGSGNVTTSFGELASPVSGADHYLEVGFTAGTGSLPAGGNSGEVQTRFAKTNWSNYDETDDYSYNADLASFTFRIILMPPSAATRPP